VLAPAATAKVVAVCRRSWKRNPSTPAARVLGIQTRRVKVAAADRATTLGREHQPVRAGLGIDAQVLGQRLGRNRGQRHRPQAGASLGRPEGKPAADLQELLGHRDPAVQQVHPPHTEAEVQRLEALGATRYDHQQERGFDFWVLRDPWGNEFCVLHPNFPELLARRRPWTS
jgi:hypothetical protein